MEVGEYLNRATLPPFAFVDVTSGHDLSGNTCQLGAQIASGWKQALLAPVSSPCPSSDLPGALYHSLNVEGHFVLLMCKR